MQTEAERPDRGWTRIREESSGFAPIVLALGIISLLLAIFGTFAVITTLGFKPVPVLVESFKSPVLRVALLAAAGIGLVSGVVGAAIYRRMPTKVSKEQAVAGAVLGVQGLVIALLIFVFSLGDVKTFAVNYMDFAVFDKETRDAFLLGMWNTIRLAFVSEALGVVLGLVLAVFAISKRSVVRAPARVYINFFRGTPLVWQLLFIGIGIPIGLRIDIQTYEAATIALSLNTGAYAAEVFRAGIQSIEKGQLEASRGLGMSYMQAMRYAVIPQAVRRVIPPLMNEFVILIKDTSLVLILGLTAAQREIMSVGDAFVANSFNATYYIATAVAYLIVSLPLIGIVNVLERRLRSGLVGVTG